MYYSNGYDSTYEDLLTMYPAFYRDVVEMQAILRADGTALDGAINSIDESLNDTFITTMSEQMVSRMERYVGVATDSGASLENRRNNILSYFTGFGKVSASGLRKTIKALVGKESTISFNEHDGSGNYILSINIQKAVLSNDDRAIIEAVLRRRLPAHLITQVTYDDEIATPANITCAAVEYHRYNINPATT